MKRLITCSDGTWNKPGNKDRGQLVRSNVELVYNLIVDGKTGADEQCKIYDPGVGSSSFDAKDKLLGGATGLGIDKNIKDMYAFLMLNYEPGADIYLFGFSRGAYTARSLAGLIRCCGLLKPENLHLVSYAYELYRDRNSYTHPDSDLMKSFKRNYCFAEVTPIKFLGVWDTVGSLGIPLPIYKMYNRERYKFHDVTISSTVQFAYHALAINERRKLFRPTLWQLSKTVANDKSHPQVMEQRWFAGAHCNIGGGYSDHGLSDIALNWLVKKATDTGLKVDAQLLSTLDPGYEIKDNYLGEDRNSRTAMYWFWLPVWRDIMAPSKYPTNEVIDESVVKRYKENSKYRPGNLRDKIK